MAYKIKSDPHSYIGAQARIQLQTMRESIAAIRAELIEVERNLEAHGYVHGKLNLSSYSAAVERAAATHATLTACDEVHNGKRDPESDAALGRALRVVTAEDVCEAASTPAIWEVLDSNNRTAMKAVAEQWLPVVRAAVAVKATK